MACPSLSQRAETCPPCPSLPVLACCPGVVKNQWWEQEKFQEEICEKLLQHFSIVRFLQKMSYHTWHSSLVFVAITPLAFKHAGLSPALLSSWNQKLSFGVLLPFSAQAFTIPSPPSPKRLFRLYLLSMCDECCHGNSQLCLWWIWAWMAFQPLKMNQGNVTHLQWTALKIIVEHRSVHNYRPNAGIKHSLCGWVLLSKCQKK